MATAKKVAPAAKKVAPKPVPAKTTATKAAPKKAAAPVAKATPSKAEVAAKAKEAAAAKATKAAATEANRKAREEARQAQITETMKLRSEGSKWPEVAEALGISIGKAQLLGKIGEAQASGALKKATPALVRKDRDERKLGWDDIGVQYGLNKGQVQKLYREAGGDPHKSYVGKGGRYFSHEADIAHLRSEKTEKAPKAPGAPKATAPAGKPIFAADAEADAVKAKIDGKTITTVSDVKGLQVTATATVKTGTVKVGKQKDGTRVVQFTDVKTGGTRTVKLDTIVKVTR